MKRKLTLLIAALALLTMGVLPGRAVGQTPISVDDLNWGTPQISENFNSLAITSATAKINSDSQTAYGAFNKMYNNNTGNTYAIVNDEETFNSKILSLTSGSSSPLIASITKVNGEAVEFESTGAFSVRIAKTNYTMFGLYAADGNGAYAKADASVYLKFQVGSLTICDGSGWVSVGSYGYGHPDITEIRVVYNNTDTDATYGNGISIGAYKAHIFVNGSCVMNGDNPKAFTIPGKTLTVFRILPNASSGATCTVDAVNIYDALPTASGPTCTASPTSWDFGEMQAGSAEQTKQFTVTTANLTNNLSVEILEGTYYSVNVDEILSTETSKTLTVTLNPTTVGSMDDYLIISGTDLANDIEVELTATGLCNAPENALAFTTPVPLTLSGDAVEYTLDPTANTGNGGNITYELTTNPGDNGMIEGNVFTAVETGTYVVHATQALNGTTCGGTFDITINVTGLDPVCTIDPEVWDFDNVAIGETSAKTFTVTTANLNSNIALAMDNAAYTVSPNSIEQNASSTQITITFAPTDAGEVESYLTANGGGINNDELAIVSGTGATPRTITFNPGTGSCTTTSMTGIDGSSITLPLASTVTAPEGWDFAGWCATNVETATTDEPTLLSGSYTIAGDATLYAVYSKTVENVFDNITGGDFMIYAKVDAVNRYATGTGDKISSTTDSDDATIYTFEKPNGDYGDNEWAIKTGSTYITYASSTNLGTSSNAYKWTISSATYGTWRVASGTSGRAMIYREGTTYKFGGYSTSNVNGTEYFDLEIGGTTTTTYHTSPTAKVATPTIEVAGVGAEASNTYYVTATITLTCSTAGATIHYTTDDTDPTESSPTYSAPFAVTESSTIKAIAVRADFTDSDIVSQEINIVQPNTATFTDGVYTTLSSSDDFNNWYRYSVTGDLSWFWYTYYTSEYARMSGYSSGNHENEDWLISPKMEVSGTPLAISFDCGADYGKGGEGAIPSVLYSINYPGYGDPNSYSWTKLQDLPYDNDLTFTTLSMTIPANTQVFFAFKYVSTDSDASTLGIKNFTAKQCYTVTYDANGGTGTMTDANSPYAVGATVTTLANTFTPPTDMIFEGWNDGTNTYAEGATFTMPNNAVTLTAQWIYPCTVTATMGATEAEAVYVNNAGVKSYKITMSSMVTVLGGCDITEYGFVYSTIEEQPTLENATKLAVGSTYTVVETPFNGEIADAEGTYYVRAFAKNAAGPAYSDAAVTVVVPDTYPTCTISYKTNGVNEEETTQAYIGDVVTSFITPTQGNIPTEFTFAGWSASVSSTEVISSITPEEDITLHAVLDYGGTYDLVTNIAELKVGDIIVIAASGYDYAMSKTQNTNNRGQADITKTDNQITLTENVCEFVLGAGTTSGTWSFYDDNYSGYIYAASSSSNLLKTETTLTANSSWVISISDNIASIEAQGTNTRNVMQYNYSNSLFSCYATASQKAISLYKKHSSSYINVLVEDLAGNIEITEPTYIPAGFIVDAGDHTITTTAANLIIEDGGQLIHENDVNATMQKEVTAWTAKDVGGWYLIASPVDEFEITQLIGDAGTYDLFSYYEPTAQWHSHNSSQLSGTFSTLTRGQGYLYANQAAKVVNYAGTMKATNEPVNLSYSDSAPENLKGFNLVGNPFTRNLILGDMKLGGTTLTTFYVVSTDRTALQAITSDAYQIKPGEGFFVQVGTTGQQLVFNPSAKDDFEFRYIKIVAGNENGTDNAYININCGNTLRKMDITERTNVYVINEGDDYAAARVDELAGDMPVHFEAVADGTYTITIEAKNTDVQYMHLFDKMTGADIDLTLESSYTFDATANDDPARFRLMFDFNNYTGVEDNQMSENFVYQFGDELIVNGEGTLQVFDVMGRLVTSFTVNGNERLSTSQLNTGVYIFRMVGSEVKTQKIVVR